KLTSAPELPATILAEDCYYCMFCECTSLTTALDLLATNLTKDCYAYMFRDCKSLTTAPYLPAMTLTNKCYQYMFSGCTLLNSIKIAYKGNYSDTYFDYWVNGIADSGTFYYNGEDSLENYGFPSGWKVEPFSN
ncbi:MAG: hypothetical protein II392_01835, partial [Mycoplasma sp.]|nr:hypothetical protein [Mycoplasma sp.]